MLREDTERYYRELADYHRRMRDVPPEKMTDFFTNRIVGYEAHMLLFEAGYRSFAAVFAEKWNALPAEYRRRPVTDLGCGTGMELDYLYPHCPTLSVCGIDLNEAMLCRCRERHPDRQIETVCADYFKADLPAAPAVLSFESLHHFPLAEKKRSIPGSRTVCCRAASSSSGIIWRAACGRRRCARRSQRKNGSGSTFRRSSSSTWTHRSITKRNGKRCETPAFVPQRSYRWRTVSSFCTRKNKQQKIAGKPYTGGRLAIFYVVLVRQRAISMPWAFA